MITEHDTDTTKHTVELSTRQLRTLLALVQSHNEALAEDADPEMLDAEEALRMG